MPFPIFSNFSESCPVKFERVGCYRDRGRPLSSYILTDRDKRHRASSGRDIDWNHYDTYLPDFACRCAMKTVEYGWNTFGVQYYGKTRPKPSARFACFNRSFSRRGDKIFTQLWLLRQIIHQEFYLYAHHTHFSWF